MTTDQARAQLEAMIGRPLTAAEQQQAQQLLQSVGWSGGDISDQQFGVLQSVANGSQVIDNGGVSRQAPTVQRATPNETGQLAGTNPIGNQYGVNIYDPTTGQTTVQVPDQHYLIDNGGDGRRAGSTDDGRVRVIVDPPPTPPPTPPPDTPTPPTPPTTPSSPGTLSLQDYTAPKAFSGPPAFSYADFRAPTAGDVLNDQGYQFALNQGLQALGHSAAARGTLNTGGTMGDYVKYASDLASSKYNDIFTRDLNAYQVNRAGALEAYNTNYGTQYKDPYQINYQTQYLDPFNLNNSAALSEWNANQGAYQFGASLNQNESQFGRNLAQNQSQFGQTLAQNQNQFTASLAQQDKIAQQQFGLSYAQLDAQKQLQVQQLAQNQKQFEASLGQNQSQFNANLTETQRQQKDYYDFNRWLQQYNMSRYDRNDAFDQRYKLLGLM